jgi:hypothetical protein
MQAYIMFVSAKVRVFTDSTGASVELLGLLTPDGLLTPLLDYFLEKRNKRSPAWMSKVLHSVELFLEYVIANPLERDSHKLFVNFAERLYIGTFDPETGTDPSGLCWMPRSATNARKIIVNLSLFFKWLGQSNPLAAAINPRVHATTYDRYWSELAIQYRRDNELLGHLWTEDAEYGTKWAVEASREPMTEYVERPAFPDDRFDELIFDGFQVGGKRDYRGILITLLLHGAGFRESEPFHLYIEDVIPDPRAPQTALVRIHHPSEGYAPVVSKDSLGRHRKMRRAAYLAEKFGLLPRHKLFGSRKAGWKGGLHDGDVYKEAFWFQPSYGELFLDIWMRYLHQVARVSRAHPFALINLGREPIGEMYSLAQFNGAHAAACKRIGLEVRKELGTTPHGHRHAYGQRLAKAGVDKMEIRRCMHHASPESQVVYTQPDFDDIRKKLEEASLKLPKKSYLVSKDLEF